MRRYDECIEFNDFSFSTRFACVRLRVVSEKVEKRSFAMLNM